MMKYIQHLIAAVFISISSIGFASSSIIKGHIIDVKTGKPLAATNIEIIGTTIGAAADDQGDFVIRDLPPGKYILKITQIGYKTVQKNLS
jgi:outer membrane receptor for ferrienterochelin and colicins